MRNLKRTISMLMCVVLLLGTDSSEDMQDAEEVPTESSTGKKESALKSVFRLWSS